MILLTTSNNLKREASNNMLSRRAHRIVLLLALLVGSAGMNYVEAQTSGSCGTSVTWSLNTSTGVLTISGSGAMTNFAGGGAPWYTNYRTTIKEVKINSGVTTIGARSFEFCENLTKVTMPNTVTSIGNTAFSNCTKLATVTLSSNLTTISSNAFYKSAITSITIPANVTSVGSSAFQGCTSLKTVKFNTTKITTLPENLFSGCTALTSINIPSGVTTIGGYLCYNCSSLPSITVPNTVTTIGIGAFEGCSAMTTATLSTALTAIPRDLFYNCTKLKTCAIPASVTTIGNSAFSDCSSLASVTIPANVTSIGEAAFSDCSSIQTVTFSGTKLTAISNNLFNSCISLKSITIPNGVTSIGNYAFRWCSSITSVSYANASKITSLGSGAFSGCTGLTSINIPANVKTIPDDLYYGCTGLTTITIPSQVTSIGLEAFRNCNSVTKVTIPVGVTTIGNYAFSISSLTDIHVSWTSSSAIPTWNNLSNTSGVKLHIPCGTGSVYRAKTGWKNYAIVGTTQYKLTVSASNSAYGSVKIGSGTASGSVSQNTYCEQEVQLTAVPKTGYHFTKWSGGSTATTNPLTIYMPSAAATYTANFAITNYTITAKTNNSSLGTVSGGGTYQEGKTATLTATPANCTSAFVQWNDGNTNNPRSFTVTENKTLTAQFASLTGNCGANGNNLTWSLNRCTGVMTISGSGAMKDWSAATDVPWCNYGGNITSVVLPYGLTHIGAYAFYGTAITKVDIPITVQSFGSFAFVYSGLQEICIPEGVTTLPNNLFHHGVSITCTTPLKRIYLPSTLTTIANQAIGRHYLSTLTYPASITSLGSSIYYSGTSPVQKDVYASWPIGQIPQKPGVNFSNPPSKPNMHVPYGTKSAYGSKGWSQFYTIVEDVDERAIDLGLSIRWASCNIGATEPEENGNFYAWGDTLTRSSFTWGTYPYSGTTTNTMTKYCTRAVNGTVDNRSTLIAFDDAAYINWGETWRMPTWAEWNELITQCTWKDTTYNDVPVWQVTGPNGNSIYLPKVGYKNSTSVTAGCYYWSSTLNTTNSNDQCNRALYINAANRSGAMYGLRYVGMPVRAVYRREWPSFTLTITDTPEGTPYTKAINAGSSYTLTAQEDECHTFVRWSDGNTSNPRTVSVTADATYTAQYETDLFTVTVQAADPTMGDVNIVVN